jgi:hypothetical protein
LSDDGTPSIAFDFFAIANRLREIKGGRRCDCGGRFGHNYGCNIFACHVCGAQCDSAPVDGPAVCEEHCPDHDYRYERGEGHRCITCGSPPPDDWFSVD